MKISGSTAKNKGPDRTVPRTRHRELDVSRHRPHLGAPTKRRRTRHLASIPPAAEPHADSGKEEKPKRRSVPPKVIEGFEELARSEIQHKDELEKKVSALIELVEGESYAVRVNNALFTYWLHNDYDVHMVEDDNAVANLLEKLAYLQQAGYRIFGRKILETGCGTGTLIRSLCEVLSPEDVEKISFAANDLNSTDALREVIDRKVADATMQPSSLTHMQQDIRNLNMDPESVHTAIMGQQLHLITDPELLEKEMMKGGFRRSDQHKKIKITALTNIFRTLEMNGHFILIEQFPEKYSGSDPIIESLFYRTMRSIHEVSTVRNMMRDIPGARIVCQFPARVDEERFMHVLVYKKDPDKLGKRQNLRGQPKPVDDAIERTLQAFVTAEPTFIGSFSHNGGNGNTEFTNFDPDRALYVRGTNDLMELARKGHDSIVFRKNLHGISAKTLRELIRAAVRSLNKGGSLIFVDEWPPPKVRRNPYMRKSTIMNIMSSHHDDTMMFEGFWREPVKLGYYNGVYGIMFRKIAD